MGNINKRFKIIEKIKSFVIKEKNYDKAKESDDITKEIASKIQISSYNLVKAIDKDNSYTPPYKLIAEQLSVDDALIFKSAAYHLVKIATRHKKYKNDISKILSEKQKEFNKTDDKFLYLEELLKNI
ncbi:MAG: hypothetical protein PHE89_07450 [Alphaproteobacteria bacterium]|nr:hypothetical protein [Alphaproteobacteria bacterium]